MNFPQNQNPNFPLFLDHHHHNATMVEPEFEISDYLIFDDYYHHDHHHRDQDNQDSYSSQSMVSSETIPQGTSSDATSSNSNMQVKCENRMAMKKKKDTELGNRVAFKTKSELEVMDDGFKWRKYGKKSVKNSPNPRNYYKCSNEGCNVKKRVERDREDSSYVITTYEGVHNHETPCVVYYNQIPSLNTLPNDAWTSQASSPPFSSSSS
ncbi:probable WRKY transcription factor 51 isoform X1 [Mangifera indica]|uniref:probable WRKY transcription factor 51 isoform X1 n=1 Tax=Mangifera indica TaxID=29780 RepID=UPI001CF9D8A4|nr:probable WRKY transcription factor 51 isoform X1 [Mangifera indica]